MYDTASEVQAQSLDAEIEGIAAPLVEQQGLRVVEVSHSYQRLALCVYVVVYASGGVTSDMCGELHKALLPRLCVYLARQSVQLQVSSPGVSRELKSLKEFVLFCGRKFEVLLVGESEWRPMRLEGVQGRTLRFLRGESSHTLQYDDIAKARLDGRAV